MSLSYGRPVRAIPGPSIIPDRVLTAMHRPAPNIYEGELVELTETVRADLCRVARTAGKVAIYIGNGHGAWEAAIANILRPGEKALVIVTGRFGAGWGEMARRMGVVVEVMASGFRSGVDADRVEARLREDHTHEIRAILCVQTDTASSVKNDVAALRSAIDAAGHPALLAIDCIASLACDRFEMDAWGVDVMVAACQKGLMVPPGVAFTFHGPRAEREGCASPYWDWGPRTTPGHFYEYFCGTAPTHHLFGLREALDMILVEEGIERTWARHETLAQAVWAAIDVWGTQGAIAPNIEPRDLRSAAVTTVRIGPGDGPRLRRWCEDFAGVTLGIALEAPGEDTTALFRIGHMGHLNPPMILGTLATIEAGLAALGIAHGRGGVEAAAAIIAAATA